MKLDFYIVVTAQLHYMRLACICFDNTSSSVLREGKINPANKDRLSVQQEVCIRASILKYDCLLCLYYYAAFCLLYFAHARSHEIMMRLVEKVYHNFHVNCAIMGPLAHYHGQYCFHMTQVFSALIVLNFAHNSFYGNQYMHIVFRLADDLHTGYVTSLFK